MVKLSVAPQSETETPRWYSYWNAPRGRQRCAASNKREGLPPSSSPVVRLRLDPLMPQPSTAPSPVVDATLSSGVDARSSPPEGSKISRGVGVILDSGAALHATGCAELLSGPRRPAPEGSGPFRTRGGEVLDAVAVGSVATPRFLVHQVYHVPGLGRERAVVVSVRQLTRLGLAVTFGCDACDVRERSTGAVVGEGRLREEDGFYYLDYLRVPQS